jgi:flagellar protein FlaI
MIKLKGILRKKFIREPVSYPHFLINEPKIILSLPFSKPGPNVDIKYPLLEPFVFAHIKWNKKKKALFYEVVEPTLSKREKEMLEKIEKILTETIDIKMSAFKTKDESITYIETKFRKVLDENEIKLTPEEYLKIMYYIYRNFIGLNEIEPLMHDPYIEDIGCSGLGTPIYVVHRRFGSMETNIVYNDFEYLNNFVIKLSERCGRYISYATPLLDGTLPDGSRVQASMARDVTTKGPTFSIRKFRKNPFSPTDIINLKTASIDLMAYLWFLIEHDSSILVCGGVATGKTTFLNCLSMFIPPEDKVISIEDTREINIPHENWIPAVTRTGFGMPEGGKRYGEISLFDLLKESFRMKPDYVIVGEVRGSEAYVMFQGISSGHPSLGTLHAGSVEDVIKRLSTPPIDLSPSLIEALDLIIIMTKAKEKGESDRRVKAVYEIQNVDAETKKVRTIKTFEWIPSSDTFKNNVIQSQILRKISFETGIPYNKILKELEDRKKVLEWMVKYNVTQFDDVYSFINMYYREKPKLMKWVRNDTPPTQIKTKKIIKELESVTGLKMLK